VGEGLNGTRVDREGDENYKRGFDNPRLFYFLSTKYWALICILNTIC